MPGHGRSRGVIAAGDSLLYGDRWTRTGERVAPQPWLSTEESWAPPIYALEQPQELQRREDAGEAVGPIPVPPKYAAADFKNADLWRLRGKLDMPKERFISYLCAERDSDRALVVGRAGWNHLQQTMALTAYYDRMKHREGWAPERLVPLLAGLGQLVRRLLQLLKIS